MQEAAGGSNDKKSVTGSQQQSVFFHFLLLQFFFIFFFYQKQKHIPSFLLPAGGYLWEVLASFSYMAAAVTWLVNIK